MAESVECRVEDRKDGVKICGLHKKPLIEVTVLEQAPPYTKIETREWECPISGEVFRVPEALEPG